MLAKYNKKASLADHSAGDVLSVSSHLT